MPIAGAGAAPEPTRPRIHLAPLAVRQILHGSARGCALSPLRERARERLQPILPGEGACPAPTSHRPESPAGRIEPSPNRSARSRAPRLVLRRRDSALQSRCGQPAPRPPLDDCSFDEPGRPGNAAAA